jgi:DNA-binding NarL/FixJ family response regulator
VLIVEDHRLLGDGLAGALCRAGVAARVVYPQQVADVLACVRQLRPSLVLLDVDLGMRDGNGDAAVPGIVDEAVDVALLTGSRDRDAIARCLEAGALTLISKAETLDRVIEVVQSLLNGDAPPGREERNALVAERRERELRRARQLAPFAKLSPREADVLRALADGRSVETVAVESYVSVATVRSQVRSILLKLDVNSQLAAVAVARQSGWLDGAGAGGG